MEEVIACENRFEREFTHYPRTFNASNFRPCHYFHKMYGTSTGGYVLNMGYATSVSSRCTLAVVEFSSMLMDTVRILAIALSRLRMTVAQTIVALESILNAMYANARTKLPLATKYSHSNLEAALVSMVQKYCKQHEQGLCNHEEKFQWRSTGMDTGEVYEDGDNSDESDVWQDRYASQRRTFEPHAPEYHLCQT
jgi:hypothetical protein